MPNDNAFKTREAVRPYASIAISLSAKVVSVMKRIAINAAIPIEANQKVR